MATEIKCVRQHSLSLRCPSQASPAYARHAGSHSAQITVGNVREPDLLDVCATDLRTFHIQATVMAGSLRRMADDPLFHVVLSLSTGKVQELDLRAPNAVAAVDTAAHYLGCLSGRIADEPSAVRMAHARPVNE